MYTLNHDWELEQFDWIWFLFRFYWIKTNLIISHIQINNVISRLCVVSLEHRVCMKSRRLSCISVKKYDEFVPTEEAGVVKSMVVGSILPICRLPTEPSSSVEPICSYFFTSLFQLGFTLTRVWKFNTE